MTQLREISFANPAFLWLLLLIPVMITWYAFRQSRVQADLRLSSFENLKAIRPTVRQRMRHLPIVLRMLTLTFLIIALARPQSTSSSQDIDIEGIDIVLANDISGSMLAEDLRPNRLGAAKNVARDFILSRPNDRMGLVAFSGEAFTQCPLTTDTMVLLSQVKQLKSGIIEDGTAIGDGLATAVSRLKESKAVSKVIILLTDGINNMGSIDPFSASEIASLFKIRVYTIGVGTYGKAPYPVPTPFGVQYQNVDVQIDEGLLKQIASATGGKYFRATSNQTLENIYKEIDRMEKTKINVLEFRKKKEEFLPLVLIAIGIFLLEIILRNSILRTNP